MFAQMVYSPPREEPYEIVPPALMGKYVARLKSMFRGTIDAAWDGASIRIRKMAGAPVQLPNLVFDSEIESAHLETTAQS